MEYRLEVSGQALDVAESPCGNDGEVRQFVVDGRTYSVSFQALRPNQLRLTVDGEAMEVFVADSGRGGKEVCVDGRSFSVIDPARRPRRRGTGGPAAPGEVTPPMPAVVVGVLVEVGDAVSKGQSLVVVSAMKMEVTLRAPADGVVSKVNTSLQAKVVPGDILVEIDESKGVQE